MFVRLKSPEDTDADSTKVTSTIIKREESEAPTELSQQDSITLMAQSLIEDSNNTNIIRVGPMNSLSQDKSLISMKAHLSKTLELLRESFGPKAEMPSKAEEKSVQEEHKEKKTKKVRCSCKRSQCLKLYCECFAAGEYCNGCKCECCSNNVEHEEERQQKIKEVIEKKPNAFKNKAVIDEETKELNPPQLRRCNCRKSNCLKKYCDCFQSGLKCTELCKCDGCQNCDKSHQHAKSVRPNLKGNFSICPLLYLTSRSLEEYFSIENSRTSRHEHSSSKSRSHLTYDQNYYWEGSYSHSYHDEHENSSPRSFQEDDDDSTTGQFPRKRRCITVNFFNSFTDFFSTSKLPVKESTYEAKPERPMLLREINKLETIKAKPTTFFHKIGTFSGTTSSMYFEKLSFETPRTKVL